MLAYRREGSGPPLLLIHGWGVRYTIWRNLAPLLRSHFTLIKIELPGIGGSPPIDAEQPYYPACADEIEELRLALGIEQWAILAYSSGTRAAEAYVRRYPQYVSRAIFLCPAYLTELSALGLRLAWWLDNTKSEVVDWALTDWRLYGLVRALGFNGRGHQYSRVWTSEIRKQSLDNLKRMLYEMPGRGRAPFEMPEVPTLFIWGSRDALMARPIRGRRTHGPSHVSIAADHSAPMLAANAVADVVVPFLTTGRVVRGRSRLRRLQSAVRLSASERAELRELRDLLRRERDQFLRLLHAASRSRLLPSSRLLPTRRGNSHGKARAGRSPLRRYRVVSSSLRRLTSRRAG